MTRTPDLIVEGHQRLTSTVSDREPDDPEDYAAAKLTLTMPIPIYLDAAQARKLAALLADYADEVDRQNGVSS